MHWCLVIFITICFVVGGTSDKCFKDKEYEKLSIEYYTQYTAIMKKLTAKCKKESPKQSDNDAATCASKKLFGTFGECEKKNSKGMAEVRNCINKKLDIITCDAVIKSFDEIKADRLAICLDNKKFVVENAINKCKHAKSVHKCINKDLYGDCDEITAESMEKLKDNK